MSPPLFSIVTVVRDDVAGLDRVGACLRRQGFRDFEWIVVDGDSRDGGREWLESHRHEIAWSRSAPDDGLYDAMTIGLAASRGLYVSFLNAGDALADNDTLDAFAQALSARNWPDFCYGDAWEEVAGGAPLYKRARSHRAKWYGMFTHHQAMLYRRAILDGLRFDPAYPVGADYAFTLGALERATTCAHVSRPFCVFAAGGLSQTRRALGRDDQSRIRRDLLHYGPFRRAAIRLAQLLASVIRKYFPEIFRALRCEKAEFFGGYGVNGTAGE